MASISAGSVMQTMNRRRPEQPGRGQARYGSGYFLPYRPTRTQGRAPRSMRASDYIIVPFFLLCCAVLRLVPTGFEGSQSDESFLAKARVVAVDNADLRRSPVVLTGTQDLQVELLDGPHRGARARVVNPLAGKLEFDEVYRPGDTILVEYRLHQGRVHLAYTRGYYRLTHETVLIVRSILKSAGLRLAIEAR